MPQFYYQLFLLCSKHSAYPKQHHPAIKIAFNVCFLFNLLYFGTIAQRFSMHLSIHLDLLNFEFWEWSLVFIAHKWHIPSSPSYFIVTNLPIYYIDDRTKLMHNKKNCYSARIELKTKGDRMIKKEDKKTKKKRQKDKRKRQKDEKETKRRYKAIKKITAKRFVIWRRQLNEWSKWRKISKFLLINVEHNLQLLCSRPWT